MVFGRSEKEQEVNDVARALVMGGLHHVSVLNVGVGALLKRGLLSEQGPDMFRSKLESNLAQLANSNGGDSGDGRLSRSGRGSSRKSLSSSMD